ncbi:hypothetical protein DFH11DRAFT_1806343 [Phellopilus nigrolimitatus]|nr:hypothetical protein DFH11DRAFT_1806343 [Phellopilus nigrolimitatus]
MPDNENEEISRTAASRVYMPSLPMILFAVDSCSAFVPLTVKLLFESHAPFLQIARHYDMIHMVRNSYNASAEIAQQISAIQNLYQVQQGSSLLSTCETDGQTREHLIETFILNEQRMAAEQGARGVTGKGWKNSQDQTQDSPQKNRKAEKENYQVNSTDSEATPNSGRHTSCYTSGVQPENELGYGCTIVRSCVSEGLYPETQNRFVQGSVSGSIPETPYQLDKTSKSPLPFSPLELDAEKHMFDPGPIMLMHMLTLDQQVTRAEHVSALVAPNDGDDGALDVKGDTHVAGSSVQLARPSNPIPNLVLNDDANDLAA